MLHWPALLRVLLCLTLIFNGSGAAIASTRMQLMHAGHVHADNMQGNSMHGNSIHADNLKTAERRQQASATPCHQHVGMAAMQHHTAPTGMTDDGSRQASKQPSPDCCRAGLCDCACVQHTLLVLTWPALAPPTTAHDGVVPVMTTVHPAPALQELNRPPIG